MELTLTKTPSVTSKGQSTLVFDNIRNEILIGKLQPLQKLKIQELADQFDVSPGAVREALSRLTSQQLVVAQSNRGFVVSPISIDDLIDLTELRCAIEALAIKQSLKLGGRDWEARVLATSHLLSSTPAYLEDNQTVSPEWIEAHANFHYTLVSACNSPRILALHSQLYEQSERYRQYTARTARPREVADEHKKFADLAIKHADIELVEELQNHIRRTTDKIISQYSKP